MTPEPRASAEMPKYRCHKEVHALKIAKVEFQCNPETFKPSTATIEVEADWVRRLPDTQPIVGGYYVVYSDGYTSWSPAKAFEDGYTRVG